jgi:hypothetical protein
MTVRHWGPHFALNHWGPHFPDTGTNPALFAAFEPGGVATLAFPIETGMTLNLEWVTDVIKTDSGLEQRIANIVSPKQVFAGSIVLDRNQSRTIRAMFARFGASGATYLFGVPYEAITLVADAIGTNVFVSSTAFCDWQEPGQRVLVRDSDGNVAEAIIQAVVGTTITLDKSVGSIGRATSEIMPARQVFLSPQQNFHRYPAEDVEVWSFEARATSFSWALPHATLALGPLSTSGSLTNAYITARSGGLVQISFGTLAFGLGVGTLSESPGLVVFQYQGGVTTVGNLEDALNLSSQVKLTGTFNRANVLNAATDAIPGSFLVNASSTGSIGTGAALTMYQSKPVWDRRIQVEGSAGDSVLTLVEVIDLNGRPYAIKTADYADWGRSLRIASTSRAEWQWLKKFLWSVRGREKSFWLPTWRQDLQYVSHVGASVVVSAGDILAWWPRQRKYVQVEQANGSLTYCEITAVVDNHDGTYSCTLSTSLAASAVTRISWLELSHFERDSIDITFKGQSFQMTTDARVVQR